MRRLIFVLFVFVFGTSQQSIAAVIGYDFTGLVLSSTDPFGAVIPATPIPSTVTGHFEYDTSSPVTHSINGTGYRQQRPGGFSATFGTIDVSADDYIVLVSNDFMGTDQFNIIFDSNLTPPLTSPLIVDGMSQTTGLFQVNLTGSDSLFSDESLPVSLDLANFFLTFSFLSEEPEGAVGVLFNISSLTMVVPEPTAGVLIMIGFISVLGFRSQRRLYRV